MRRPASLDRLRPAVEAELRKIVGRGRSPLHDMARYQMGWMDEMRSATLHPAGERLHAVVCLLTGEACGGEHEHLMSVAAGFEFTAAALLVQEQLRLGLPSAEGRSSLWWVWGHAQGINAADGLYSLGRLAIADTARDPSLPERVLAAIARLDQACLEAAEGTFDEIEAETGRDGSARDYLHMVDRQYGALLGASAAAGATLAGASEIAVRSADRAGRLIGSVKQIRHDLDALAPGGPAGHTLDLLQRGRSLPLKLAMEHGDGEARETIARFIGREAVVDDAGFHSLVDAIERTGGRLAAEEALKGMARDAKTALCDLPPGTAAQELATLVDYVASGMDLS